MKTFFYLSFILFFQFNFINAQVTIEADGPGGVATYTIIRNVLGSTAIESPDINGDNPGTHTGFGAHITEEFDSDLGKNVFNFLIHLTPDNDTSTGSTDRQRLEIKSYASSAANLKGTLGETVRYKWKFKIPAGFMPSPNFTHIHQLKAVGGDDGNPIFAITLRKSASAGSESKLELNYYPPATSSATKLLNLNMSLFEGHWVEVTETVTYGDASTSAYDFNIKKISDPLVSYSFNSSSLVTFRPTNTFVRPKWGIYRSIAAPTGMKDENLLFADFSIEENPTLSVNKLENKNNLISIFPNPSTYEVYIKETIPNIFNNINILDNLGRIISTQKSSSKTINISNLKKGLYFIELKKDSDTICIEKLIVI